MKKLLALISVSLALVSGASAASYTDVNPANVRLDSNAGGYFGPYWISNPLYNPSYTGTFTLASYDPLAEEIVSASVSFKLWDGDLFKETYSLSLSDMAFSGSNFFGFVTFGGAVVGNALFDLSSTGALSYTITANSGTFWLKEATLHAESAAIVVPENIPASVPETGATAVLTSAALLGLAAFKRKQRA
jgi:hypothetical protein